MDPIRTLHPLARAWLLDGPLSAHLDAYMALLDRGRYAEGSIEKHLRMLAHFAHWMTRCHLAAQQLDEDFVDQFLNHHLPRCDCHATALRTHGDLSAGLGHLLVVLRQQRVMDAAACAPCRASGRRERSVPLWRSTVKAIRAWLRLNIDLGPTSALLPNRGGEPMTRSNVTQRLALAVKAATSTMPSLAKRSISPHTLRHTTAMHLLQSGVDISVIALWLGHESPTTTHQYVEADLTMKAKALGRMQDPDTLVRRFKAKDSLLEFLKTL